MITVGDHSWSLILNEFKLIEKNLRELRVGSNIKITHAKL